MSAVPSALAPGLGSPQRDLSAFLKQGKDETSTLDLVVDGIHCASCIARIEDSFAKEPRVITARCNLTDKRLKLTFAPGQADPDWAIQRVADAGFKAYPLMEGTAAKLAEDEQKYLLRCLAVAGFAAMNIMLLSVSVWSGHSTGLSADTRDFFHWVSALIALPTAAYAGRPFFDGAIRALRARALNMDVPISLGILLTLGLSVWETARGGEHAYFDGAVMLMFFLLLGRYLDQVMRRKTRAVAANLAAMRVNTAIKFIAPNDMREVPIAAIMPGDLVLVRPGDRIGVDGVIASGQSEIDQSLVTGETQLAAVKTGDTVYAGTVNHGGTLHVRVRQAGSGTLIDEIEKLLDQATHSKAQYVALADRAARLYSPVVHLTALLTFLGWIAFGLAWQKALVIAATVLIITCPCALGLAIPAVQVVAAGALFKRAVLLNAGDALERMAQVDTVVFDKTGTLTLPEPELLNVAEIDPELLAQAGALALSSRHPLAKAVAASSGAKTPLPAVNEVTGKGVEAIIGAIVMRLGSPSYCDAQAQAAAVAAEHPNASLIAYRKGDVVTVFAVAQKLRPDAVQTIADLRARGLDVHILSGDRQAPVAEAAGTLGITAIRAEAKPADKTAYLEALKAGGHKVLMVGDGINDAPALAMADVSLSPVTAADLTQAAADAVFLGEKLAPVNDAVGLSRKARAIMAQNLWFSVIYNAIAVPIAIAGYATPLIAALAMSGSSIIVVLNALRARQAS